MRRQAKKDIKQKDRTDEIFGEIVTGLGEAIAYARGKGNPRDFRVHIPETMDVRAIRKRLKMSQAAFAEHFGFSAARVRDWEQGRSSPDQAVRAYLRVIEEEPEMVERVLAAA
jgi:putative transcriptional regulator